MCLPPIHCLHISIRCREDILCAVRGSGVNLLTKVGHRRQPVGSVEKRSRFYIKITDLTAYIYMLCAQTSSNGRHLFAGEG